VSRLWPLGRQESWTKSEFYARVPLGLSYRFGPCSICIEKLTNSNPPGDFTNAAWCGRQTRRGTPCQRPGMANGATGRAFYWAEDRRKNWYIRKPMSSQAHSRVHDAGQDHARVQPNSSRDSAGTDCARCTGSRDRSDDSATRREWQSQSGGDFSTITDDGNSLSPVI
jgi:hypothetical protein